NLFSTKRRLIVERVKLAIDAERRTFARREIDGRRVTFPSERQETIQGRSRFTRLDLGTSNSTRHRHNDCGAIGKESRQCAIVLPRFSLRSRVDDRTVECSNFSVWRGAGKQVRLVRKLQIVIPVEGISRLFQRRPLPNTVVDRRPSSDLDLNATVGSYGRDSE